MNKHLTFPHFELFSPAGIVRPEGSVSERLANGRHGPIASKQKTSVAGQQISGQRIDVEGHL